VSGEPARGRRRMGRRFERWLLGLFMSLAAIVIERRLLKAIKSGSVKASKPVQPAGGFAVVPEPAAD
jgi:hypothetical protein